MVHNGQSHFEILNEISNLVCKLPTKLPTKFKGSQSFISQVNLCLITFVNLDSSRRRVGTERITYSLPRCRCVSDRLLTNKECSFHYCGIFTARGLDPNKSKRHGSCTTTTTRTDDSSTVIEVSCTANSNRQRQILLILY